MKDLNKFVPAVAISWSESEAGWGINEIGMSVYRTKKLAQNAIDKHLKDEKQRNPSGKVPSYYIKPSDPYICLITREKYETLPKNSGVYTSERAPKWYKRTSLVDF